MIVNKIDYNQLHFNRLQMIINKIDYNRSHFNRLWTIFNKNRLFYGFVMKNNRFFVVIFEIIESNRILFHYPVENFLHRDDIKINSNSFVMLSAYGDSLCFESAISILQKISKV